MRPLPVIALTALLPGCVSWFFSGMPEIDRSRPVALLETTGGVEYAATTEFGVLCLGRTAQAGRCRVRYFLGPTPMVEDGHILATGSVFFRAEMDLKTQAARALGRTVQATDQLVAMYTADGVEVTEIDVHLARGEGLDGDLLQDPGTPLPAGAAIFARDGKALRFCGLVTARATLSGDGDHSYYTFAGTDRVRELLAIPEPDRTDPRYRHRPDDITVPESRK